MAQGYLQVDVVSDVNSFPVQDADVAIARTEEPDKIIEETRTNSSGQMHRRRNFPYRRRRRSARTRNTRSGSRLRDSNRFLFPGRKFWRR